MSVRLRLGAVNYLNVRPLVYRLDGNPDVSLRFDVPAVCAKLLDDHEIDLGMVPSITYLGRPGDRIVPGVCIGSEGPVASVALYTRGLMSEVRTVALDTSSRTSAALVRILCRRIFRVSPTFVARPPDLPSMLAAADAALLIGDAALFVDHQAHGAKKVDLGALWTQMTGLPFVWAFWSGRPGAADAATVRLLQTSADRGMRQVDEIAAAYCPDAPDREALARRYLRENLTYRFDERAIEGLRTYYREAAAAGVVTAVGDLAFFEGPSAEA
jgi:predicted solute-binding protein